MTGGGPWEWAKEQFCVFLGFSGVPNFIWECDWRKIVLRLLVELEFEGGLCLCTSLVGSAFQY